MLQLYCTLLFRLDNEKSQSSRISHGNHVQYNKKLKHTVRMAFGNSESLFGGEMWRDLKALMGVGQGSGAGQAIWAVISSVFFDAL